MIRVLSGGRTALESLELRRLLSAVAAPVDDVAIQSEPPPIPGDAFVSGSRWSPALLDFLEDLPFANGLYGVELPNGPLPWANTDRFTILLGGDLEVDAADLTVRGSRVANYPVASADVRFDHSAAATIVTWTLEQPIENDIISIELNGDAPDGVHVRHGNLFLDGDRDGEEGGDFRIGLGVMVGDTSTDGRINALDLAAVKQALGGVGGTGRYGGWADIDTNGRINALDLAAVKRNLGQRLPPPPAAATLAPLPPATSVADELFGSEPILD